MLAIAPELRFDPGMLAMLRAPVEFFLSLFRSQEQNARYTAELRETVLHFKAIYIQRELDRAFADAHYAPHTVDGEATTVEALRAELDDTEEELAKLEPVPAKPNSRLDLARLEHELVRAEAEAAALQEVNRILSVRLDQAERAQTQRRPSRSRRKRKRKRR